MLRPLFALLALLAFIGGSWAEEALPAAKLKAIKAATVLIKVNCPIGAATGSGFVARATDKDIYIVTNHHVIDMALPRDGVGAFRGEVKVVFNSGTPEEAIYVPEVLGYDSNYDLAVLHLKTKGVKNPPAALDMSKRGKVAETTPVYVCGFPFGNNLKSAADDKNAAVTIGRATVSSIRQSEDGSTALVQLDGSLNPGNSGGPVVTSDGNLVGVAVMTIKGTGIGFAVPKTQVDNVMRGNVGISKLRSVGYSGKNLQLRVYLEFADPFKKIKTARLLAYEGGTQEKPPIAVPKDGRWGALPNARKIEITGWGFTATADTTLNLSGNNPTLWLQAEYELEDGIRVRTPPEWFGIRNSGTNVIIIQAPPEQSGRPVAPGNPQNPDAPVHPLPPGTNPNPNPNPPYGRPVRPVPSATVPAPPATAAIPNPATGLPATNPGEPALFDLAKNPTHYPRGKETVVYARVQGTLENWGSVALINLKNENDAKAPLRVIVPKKLGMDWAALNLPVSHATWPARVVVGRLEGTIPELRNVQEPCYALLEVGFLDVNGSIVKTLRSDEGFGEYSTYATEPAPEPKTPPAPPIAFGTEVTVPVKADTDNTPKASSNLPIILGIIGGMTLIGISGVVALVMSSSKAKRRSSRRRRRDDDFDDDDDERRENLSRWRRW